MLPQVGALRPVKPRNEPLSLMASIEQCDQIWRNFAIWATFYRLAKKLKLILCLAKLWTTESSVYDFLRWLV